MASLDNVKKAAPKKEMSDKELVSMMGMAALDNGGLQTLQTALEGSQDPAQVTAQFLAQLVGTIAEFTQQQFGIDPAVFGEPDGFLDQTLDYIERKLNLPPEFSDQVYGETLEVMKALSKGGSGAQPQQAGAPAPAAGPSPLDAPAPTGGM